MQSRRRAVAQSRTRAARSCGRTLVQRDRAVTPSRCSTVAQSRHRAPMQHGRVVAPSYSVIAQSHRRAVAPSRCSTVAQSRHRAPVQRGRAVAHSRTIALSHGRTVAPSHTRAVRSCGRELLQRNSPDVSPTKRSSVDAVSRKSTTSWDSSSVDADDKEWGRVRDRGQDQDRR
ncbi:hypothetical protein BU17DRAFT_101803 [Hysterangium stoloniferum]|nr:hypothetical protein BU17DRAFT_101803 [Hysterangium stoloniferum]